MDLKKIHRKLGAFGRFYLSFDKQLTPLQYKSIYFWCTVHYSILFIIQAALVAIVSGEANADADAQ